MKTGAPKGNQNARKPFAKAPQRRQRFSPDLWAKWHAERFTPSSKAREEQAFLAQGIEEFRHALR